MRINAFLALEANALVDSLDDPGVVHAAPGGGGLGAAFARPWRLKEA